MAFKLMASAQTRWRVNPPHLVALVRIGATFERGKLVEPPTIEEVSSWSRDTPVHRS